MMKQEKIWILKYCEHLPLKAQGPKVHLQNDSINELVLQGINLDLLLPLLQVTLHAKTHLKRGSNQGISAGFLVVGITLQMLGLETDMSLIIVDTGVLSHQN
jgi:hypothetical protein